MIKILLTGATGFVGKHVLEELATHEYFILAPVRNLNAIKDFATHKNVKFLLGDFYNDVLFQEYKNFDPDIIVHLAAIRGEGKHKWRKYYKVNIHGTEKLVSFALKHNVSRFVYCSSVGIYGTIPCRLPADIWTPAIPDGFYHLSKFKAEKYIIDYLRGRINYVIFRPTIIYGLGDNGFLSKLISMVRAHIFPLISRNILIHLLNVATIREFILKIMQHGHLDQDYIVNLADIEPVYLMELVDLIHYYFYGKPYPRWLKFPPHFFKIAEWISKPWNGIGFKISLKLISHSWYYDTSYVRPIFNCVLRNTLKSVQEYLLETFPEYATTKINK